MRTAHRRDVKRDMHYRDCRTPEERACYVELRGMGLSTNGAWYASRAIHAPTPAISEFWQELLRTDANAYAVR